MLKILVFLTGAWIYRLISGKKSDEVQLTDWQPLLLSMGFIFWLLSFLFCVAGIMGKDAGYFWSSIVFIVGFPAVLVGWGFLVRRKKK